MPNNLSLLETTNSIQVIHQAADASWQNSSQVLQCFSLHGNDAVATVFDKAQQKFVWLKSAKINTESFLQHRNIVKEMFPETAAPNMVSFVGGLKTALVPEAIYEESAKEDFFKLNHTLTANERIEASYSKKLGAYLLFAIENDLYRNLIYSQSRKVVHEDLPWLEVLLLQHKNSEDTFVHIDVQDESITIAAFRNAGLLLYNTFACETAEDKLYFTMFVSEQLRINPHKDYYFLSGKIARTDETNTLFARYIKELKFQPRPDIFQYGLPLQELPEHLYFKAFCTPICEL
ncbi:MAG: DUF3822 family protein [Bacteroidia bacterium]